MPVKIRPITQDLKASGLHQLVTKIKHRKEQSCAAEHKLCASTHISHFSALENGDIRLTAHLCNDRLGKQL